MDTEPIDRLPHGLESLDFDRADVDPNIPPDALIAIANLTLAWARFDAATSQLVFQAFGLPFDLGQILIRRMGISDKHARLTEAFAHLGNETARSDSRKREKLIEKWYPVRNVVSHSECLGISKAIHPGCLIFVTSHILKGLPGKQRISFYPLQTLIDATAFAQINTAVLVRLRDEFAAMHEKYARTARV